MSRTKKDVGMGLFVQCLYALSLHLVAVVFGTAVLTSLYIFGKCFIYLNCIHAHNQTFKVYIHWIVLLAKTFVACISYLSILPSHALTQSQHCLIMWPTAQPKMIRFVVDKGTIYIALPVCDKGLC